MRFVLLDELRQHLIIDDKEVLADDCRLISHQQNN